MRVLIAVFALALSSSWALAEECNRYVQEGDPYSWIGQTEGGLVWHKGDEGDFEFDVILSPNGHHWAAGKMLEEEDPSWAEVPFRFANVDGHEALIFDTTFFYKDCSEIAAY